MIRCNRKIATNRLDQDNEPQPDVVLFNGSACGGQSRISDDDYLTGSVEFVAEVSVSSVALDRGPKLRTYERHGVREYLIWRVDDSQGKNQQSFSTGPLMRPYWAAESVRSGYLSRRKAGLRSTLTTTRQPV